eukprot:g26686.t1
MSLSGVTIAGSRGLQFKASLYMHDITIFCLEAPTDYLMMQGIWFGRAGACAKSWDELITKVKQKMVLWEHRSPSIAGTQTCEYILKFYLLPVLQRMALALLPQNAPSSWTVPYHLSFMEKYAKKNNFDQKSIRKWSAGAIFETLREMERVDPVPWFFEQTVKVIWQNASSPELSNEHQAIAWLLVKRILPVRSFMYA